MPSLFVSPHRDRGAIEDAIKQTIAARAAAPDSFFAPSELASEEEVIVVVASSRDSLFGLLQQLGMARRQRKHRRTA